MTAQQPHRAHRAFRFCLDPTTAQRTIMFKHAGAARVAFNHALATKQDAWAARKTHIDQALAGGASITTAKGGAPKVPGAFAVQTIFNAARGDETAGIEGVFPWWREISSYAFSSARSDVDQAFTNWFASLAGDRGGKPMSAPRFKKKNRSRDSYRIYHDRKRPTIRPDGYRRLCIPRHGSIRVHDTTKPLCRMLAKGAQITSVTISRGAHRWYAAILVEYIPATPRPTRVQREAGTVGVDLGVHHLLALSTGTIIDNPRHLARARKRLTRAQRHLARTQKDSARRKKAAAAVARIHHQVAEARAGHLHQITKHIAASFTCVAVEDLNTSGMTRSARGTIEVPGRNVRAKAGLNRSILDASFGEIRRQLDYKTNWYGSTLALCDRWAPSSKTCSACGTVKATLSLGERMYHCGSCGLSLDRDTNAARNIAAWAVPVVASAVAPDTGSTLKARPSAGQSPHRGARRADASRPSSFVVTPTPQGAGVP